LLAWFTFRWEGGREEKHAAAVDRFWEEEGSPSLSSLYLYPLLKSWGVWVLV